MEGYYENSKQYNLDVISDESLNIAIRKSVILVVLKFIMI